jgi:hypothetical protein
MPDSPSTSHRIGSCSCSAAALSATSRCSCAVSLSTALAIEFISTSSADTVAWCGVETTKKTVGFSGCLDFADVLRIGSSGRTEATGNLREREMTHQTLFGFGQIFADLHQIEDHEDRGSRIRKQDLTSTLHTQKRKERIAHKR